MKSWTLTAKLYTSGLTFLVLALTSIGVTLLVTWNLEGGAAAVNEAGRMRMQTYRLALEASSKGPTRETLALVQSFDASVSLLRTGDPSRPLFVPWSRDSRQRFQLVTHTWYELRARWSAGQPSPHEAAQDAARFVALIDGFVAAIETQMSRSTTLLQGVQLAMMGFAIAGVVAMLYAGYLFVLNPLARLRRGLISVQQGDLSTRVEVDSRDEFGQLSAGFNDMAQTLQSLYGSLEDKVREKTARLEVKRQRLADLYETSAFLAEAPSLDALARGFVRQVRAIARADAAAVRWSDEGNQRYLLLATDGLPAAIVESEACLDTGACFCGQPRKDATIRIIPIQQERAMAMGYCRRAGYRTLVSVPVKLHERVLGEVDLFFFADVTLEDEERELLDTLATHLASAMESLRASALEREAAVAQERALLAQELHDSIAQSLAFLKIQVQLLRDAMRRQDTQAMERVIGELDAGVRESYADVRELLVHFRTRTTAEDIEPALRTTLSKFEHQTGLAVRLEMQGHGVPLAPDVQVQVLHILQEALSNVRKHAGAHQVLLRVSHRPHWRFEVRDDGVGFDPAAGGADQTHVGLRIMQERAQRIGAAVAVVSTPGRGCTVTLDLPPTSELDAAAPSEKVLS
ncbi:type IV pili methyl-accepting chemotaxis transducer N-terminal domain-containing protein [Ramlibacter sp.]|uniref:type IV pili methyl-accepting chemotaxis transducer N-terminal domain-containing protein n=1 Tax=Ramlibacter sp. TaxID=1917967 RepID=UPI002C4C922F|nr:type IV pili methyl-accepting chemotaxis transducer N-terminal domain-containing protein [Ramlibacter sp.]HWI81199.1 type IV pili methyl-accepting chemotaxis transducer N-terminal domain-containing protein [Ramlibacter sp.]